MPSSGQRSGQLPDMSRRSSRPRRRGTTGLETRIKLARERQGLSQNALAAKLGISAGAVGQWETGLARPAVGKLDALSKILAVSLDWLLGDSEQVPASRPAAGAGTDAEMELLNQARELGIDLKQVVAEARRQRWLEENRAAIADANAFLARCGLWSDGRRLF